MSGMSMATTSVAMMATTTMDMAMSSSTSHSMEGMSTSSSMMPASEMMMSFFTGTSTALWSSDWIPNTAGVYAGTCIFLIVFAAIFRTLVATRMHLVLFLDGAHVNIEVISKRLTARRRRWRTKEATVRASLDVVLAGMSYLL